MSFPELEFEPASRERKVDDNARTAAATADYIIYFIRLLWEKKKKIISSENIKFLQRSMQYRIVSRVLQSVLLNRTGNIGDALVQARVDELPLTS